MEVSRLRVGDSGDEVTRLHEKLKVRDVNVSPDEQRRKLFGPSTREAVREFQKTHGVDPSGEICAATATLLFSTLAAAPSAGNTTVVASRFIPVSDAPPVALDSGVIPAAASSLANPQRGSRDIPLNPIPEQFSIAGTVSTTAIVDRGGIRVQAFGRDLPSLERRAGSAPQLLGEANTDAEGRFRITYTLEQFQSGDVNSTFRRRKEKKTGHSFRIFDRTGQELKIKSIDALDRTLGPDQI
jgi:hypothetical protein